VETLCAPEDLVAWMRLADVLPPTGRVRADDGHLRRARALREAVDGLVSAHLEGRRPAQADVAELQRALEAAPERTRVGLRDGRLALEDGAADDPVGHGLGVIARDAARMLGTDERDRVRVCASDTCSARFYDRSPAGRRRWCSMSGCGNREKVRRHRASAGRTEETA
jgi:predicted RNA-binding Zn ribbon-like protein